MPLLHVSRWHGDVASYGELEGLEDMEDVRYLSHKNCVIDCSNDCSKKPDRDELRAFLDTFSQGLHRRMRKLIIALRDVAGEFDEDDSKYGLFLGQDWDLYF